MLRPTRRRSSARPAPMPAAAHPGSRAAGCRRSGVRAPARSRAPGARPGCLRATDELARDLERVEGVAFRSLDDLHDRRTRQRAAQACADHLVDRRDGERPEHEVGLPLLGQRGLEGVPAAGVGPDRAEDADLRVGASSKREGECVHVAVSSHCASSTATRTGSARASSCSARRGPRRERAAVDPAVDRSSRRSAAASARRCGAGSRSSAASSTCANRSTSPANESDASTPAGRATSTRQPRSAARATPACQTVVLPIPAGPLIASASALSRARQKRVDQGEFASTADQGWLVDSQPTEYDRSVDDGTDADHRGSPAALRPDQRAGPFRGAPDPGVRVPAGRRHGRRVPADAARPVERGRDGPRRAGRRRPGRRRRLQAPQGLDKPLPERYVHYLDHVLTATSASPR